ncbi:multidrug efflux SMR transporter [Sideroxyarcus emersonii]|uniref:DMT family transporter n=1 Tax=Sideroxyarcus emersonii TaxID=2764705 RepID=UPI001F01C477|nr:SMR family transporter [Sideroxyarcus emersonii]
MKWLILILGIVSSASASVCIKLATMPPHKLPSFNDPLAILSNLPLWFGVGFYGLAFLLYTAALKLLPLNVAYPVLTSGAVAVVALLSALIFQEPFNWMTVSGIVLVIAGVILITAKLI